MSKQHRTEQMNSNKYRLSISDATENLTIIKGDVMLDLDLTSIQNADNKCIQMQAEHESTECSITWAMASASKLRLRLRGSCGGGAGAACKLKSYTQHRKSDQWQKSMIAMMHMGCYAAADMPELCSGSAAPVGLQPTLHLLRFVQLNALCRAGKFATSVSSGEGRS